MTINKTTLENNASLHAAALNIIAIIFKESSIHHKLSTIRVIASEKKRKTNHEKLNVLCTKI